jgi:hypothetical protein
MVMARSLERTMHKSKVIIDALQMYFPTGYTKNHVIETVAEVVMQGVGRKVAPAIRVRFVSGSDIIIPLKDAVNSLPPSYTAIMTLFREYETLYYATEFLRKIYHRAAPGFFRQLYEYFVPPTPNNVVADRGFDWTTYHTGYCDALNNAIDRYMGMYYDEFTLVVQDKKSPEDFLSEMYARFPFPIVQLLREVKNTMFRDRLSAAHLYETHRFDPQWERVIEVLDGSYTFSPHTIGAT